MQAKLEMMLMLKMKEEGRERMGRVEMMEVMLLI